MPTDQELIKIVPSKRQLKYQETEFYAFFHFGMNGRKKLRTHSVKRS